MKHFRPTHVVTAAVICLWLVSPAARADGLGTRLPISTGVKILPPRSLEAELPAPGVMPAQPAPPQPTLPGGKLPQYQLGYQHRALPTPAQLQDGTLRFTLALPSRPVVIEAAITIDGLPFRMVREQRIEQILQEATQPQPAVDAAPVEAEAAPAAEPQAVPEDKDGDTEASVALPTKPAYALATAAAEFVRRYIAATGREATVEEVRWLLANRIDGPALLLLNDNFQRFRGRQRPAFYVLDRNRDGTVSADELAAAVASFNECDLDRNGIVDFAEIAKVGDDPRRQKTDESAPKPLLSVLSAPSDVAELAEPDVKLTVSFVTSDPAGSKLVVERVRGASSGEVDATADQATVTLRIDGSAVAFSAVQADPSDQISVGAVSDGYPILPVADPNDDGRFTIRELRGLEARLRMLDRNQDGQLTDDEIQPTIRVCIGLGPHVHRELAGIRTVNQPSEVPSAAAPDWFVRMDRNKDADLTRGEFPGTDEQFRVLDADGDELISAEEAANYDPQPSPTSTGTE